MIAFRKAAPFNATRIVLVCMAILLGNCTSRKNLVYFQGPKELNTDVSKAYYPTLKKDDLLSIIVMGQDPEAVVPFNIPAHQLYTSSVGGYSQGAPTQPGYLIDGDGNIDFPVVGKIKLGGLTRPEAVDLLKSKLKDYISNPNVNMRILNYKVTVLGEVRNPGTFTIPNERITILEAMGIAGDLTITGVRRDVLVIREVDGKLTETRVDLLKKDLFTSPVYYLQQNDIVYVQPNRAKVNSSVMNASNVGIVISLASVLIALATLLTINTK